METYRVAENTCSVCFVGWIDYCAFVVWLSSPVSAGITKSVAYAKTVQRTGYIPRGQIHATEDTRIEMYVPGNNAQKPYEPVDCINDKSSKQYKLLHGKNVKYNPDGTITVNGRIAVALGQRYGKVGDKFDIKLSSGAWIEAIMADAKATCDTANKNGWNGKNGHILEMIVSYPPKKAIISGSYNYKYTGEVVKVLKLQ